MFGLFEGFDLLVVFWQACARKCEPFAILRQKCEPFASLRQKCEPFASLRQECEPLRLLVEACPKVRTLLSCAPLRIAACNILQQGMVRHGTDHALFNGVSRNAHPSVAPSGQHASPPQLNQIDLIALQQPI